MKAASFVLMGCAFASCAAPQAAVVAPAEAKAAAPPLEDLGGRVFRGEAEGFKLLVDWRRPMLELRGCHPQFGCGGTYCRAEGLTAFPAVVPCSAKTKSTLSFAQIATGYRMTIAGEMTDHFQLFDPKARTLIAIARGPTTFEMVRVSPFATAFQDEAFGEPQYVPNSSPETNALGALVREPPKDSFDVAALVEMVRGLGVDPDTVPLEVVEKMRREIERRSHNRGTTLEIDSLHDTIKDLIEAVPRAVPAG